MTIAASLKMLLPPILVRAQLRQHNQLHLAGGKNRIPGRANIDLDAADGVIG